MLSVRIGVIETNGVADLMNHNASNVGDCAPATAEAKRTAI
jgi:hypothetical protein